MASSCKEASNGAVSRDGAHWKIVTIISAVRRAGPFATASIVGATDSDVFRAYVRRVLASQLQPGDGVVMDSLSAHKASGVRKAIESVGAGFTCRRILRT